MRNIISTIIGFFFSLSISAQVFTGGEASYNFDNKGSYVDVAPIIGYRMDKLELGVSPLLSLTIPREGENEYSLGTRLFTKYSIIKNIFISVEFEAMNYNIDNTRKWIYALPVGAGYRQKISDNVNADFSIMYDLLLDKDSPKENPIFRGGVNYSF